MERVRRGRRRRLLAVTVVGVLVGAVGIVGPQWVARSRATSPCPPWQTVPYTGTKPELLQDGQAVPGSHPVVGKIPQALCLEPYAGQATVLKLKDCYEPELSATFVLKSSQ